MIDDTVMSVRSVKVLGSASNDSQVNLAVAQTQLNVLNFVLKLPEIIKTAKEQIEAQQNKVEQFKRSQEPDFNFSDDRSQPVGRG